MEIPLRPGGPYTLYRVRKWGRTTLEVQAELAARLGVPQRAVIFPALKDRMALAVQMAGVRGRGPDRLRGPGFEAVRVGEADRPPGPHDLRGNRFTVRLRALTEAEQERLPRDLKRLAEEGFPNYFDDQRFGSWSPEGGFLGRFLLLGQAEEVLRRYLTVPTRADSSAVRAFKARARSLWGDWAAMFTCAPRPSTYRSLLTFLKDHPAAFRQAVRRIPRRLRILWVDAYRSWLWNLAVARVFVRYSHQDVTIRGEPFPLPEARPPEAADEVPLPHRRARYGPPWAAAMAEVLAAEGLPLERFRRGPLLEIAPAPTRRRVWCQPRGLTLLAEGRDSEGPWALLRFELPPGAYGTLLLKALAARMDRPILETGFGF